MWYGDWFNFNANQDGIREIQECSLDNLGNIKTRTSVTWSENTLGFRNISFVIMEDLIAIRFMIILQSRQTIDSFREVPRSL